jgi:carboxymethylenebutenolidase
MSKPELVETVLPFADKELHGFFCRPRVERDLPLVVFLHDIYGLREQAKDTVRRVAVQGFAVFAPHLLNRMRKAPLDPRTETKEALAIARSIAETQVRRDIDAAFHVAGKQPGVDTKRKVVWGCCWGGAFVFPTLADRPDLSAGVVFYGSLSETRTASCPRRPLDCVSAIRSPVILHYGEADELAPLEHIGHLEALLRANKVHFELYTYPGAAHAFSDETRGQFCPKSGTLAWDRTVKFLRKHV